MSQNRDIHQEITDRFIAALEAGTRPWQCDWITGGLPTRSTGDHYQGMNVLLLRMVAADRGYTNPHWLTFKQAKALGGSVRKGEKAAPVIFYKQLVRDAKDGDSRVDENGQVRINMLRTYAVFNVAQIDGLPADKFPNAEPILNDFDRDNAAEAALRSCGADIREGGGAAFYRPSSDHVQMPEFVMFKSVGGYLATLAHELTHWTGASHRLDRTKGQRFGDNAYAFEELVAEIGASFICARLGIAGDHFESHASYVASWLKVLKNDKTAIFKAASLAQAAADMVLANIDAPIEAPAAPIATPAEHAEAQRTALQLASPKRADSGRTIAAQQGERDLPLFAAADQLSLF